MQSYSNKVVEQVSRPPSLLNRLPKLSRPPHIKLAPDQPTSTYSINEALCFAAGPEALALVEVTFRCSLGVLPKLTEMPLRDSSLLDRILCSLSWMVVSIRISRHIFLRIWIKSSVRALDGITVGGSLKPEFVRSTPRHGV